MSMWVCVLDPSTPPDDVREWTCGEHHAIVSGRLGGPGVVRFLRSRSPASERVVLVHRPTEGRDAGFLANVVSGALPHVALARLEVVSTLLAATMIALEATLITDDDHVAQLSRIANSLDRTTSGLWVQKVTRLTTPNPTFGQHLRSLVPGGPGFIALRDATPRIVQAKVGSDHFGAARGRLVIGAEPDAPGVDRLRAWFGGAEAMTVPPVMASVRRGYGNAGHEFAVVDEALAEPDARTGLCRVCGEGLHRPDCPFCHVFSDTVEASLA
ncbi:MAG: hypothetical protein ACRCSN_10915 [Dermatophilaceae bacterium]